MANGGIFKEKSRVVDPAGIEDRREAESGRFSEDEGYTLGQDPSGFQYRQKG